MEIGGLDTLYFLEKQSSHRSRGVGFAWAGTAPAWAYRFIQPRKMSFLTMMEDENSSKVLPHLYAREGDLVQATNPVLQGATPDFRI